ncbi:PcfJ domain-containing protein [Enterococcus faecium]|nr:PcfJ domain-containing protein [Enterococcus faecium]
MEGSTMHHCVYNYLEKIQRGWFNYLEI